MQGFHVGEMPRQIDEKTRELLGNCETATIGHFLHGAFLAREILPVHHTKRIAGTAVTLKIAGMDSTLLHHIISKLRPGDVLVIDRCGDERHACWGGVMTHAADHQGITGVVVDGPVTDVCEIDKLGFPIWGRGRSAITTKLLGIAGEFNVPVSVGNRSISPGDALLADESGAITLQPSEAKAAAECALEMQDAERKLLEKMRAGAILGEITGASAMVSAQL